MCIISSQGKQAAEILFSACRCMQLGRAKMPGPDFWSSASSDAQLAGPLQSLLHDFVKADSLWCSSLPEAAVLEVA